MTRALVLGGGGPVGIAWESGLIAGLAQGGVDLAAADHIQGTSAGSFVGLRLAMGETSATLADPILADATSMVRNVVRSTRRPPDLTQVMRIMAKAKEAKRDLAEARAEIGALALVAPTMSEDEYIQSFGRQFAALQDDAWPARSFACTGVTADTGHFELWTKDSGVGVGRAVAASCSFPGIYPPVTINGQRWIDGGARSMTNADMVTGYDVVLIVQVRMSEWTPGGALAKLFDCLAEETAALEAGGAKVIAILPDAASVTALGGNPMDFEKRAGAARAGLAQGLAAAGEIKTAWG
jgi:NTE family protein